MGPRLPKLNLTDAYLKGLKCKGGQRLLEVRDTEVRGLEIRASLAGRKTWRLHYTRRSDAKRRVVKLGSYPSLSLKEARVKAKRIQADIEGEETRADPAAERQARKHAETFAELAREWLDRHARPNKRPRTVRGEEAMLARHVLPVLGSTKISEVTKRDIIGLLDRVATKPDARLRKRTVNTRKLTHQPNRVFELVRAVFRWGLGRDLLKLDPTFGLPPPIKKEKPRERELSADEILKLWHALDRAPVGRRYANGLPRGAAVVGEKDIPMTRATALTLKLALVTAQRIGEVACIAMAELDLNEAAPVWTIPGRRAKNGQPNRVPLSPLAVRLIAEARNLAPGADWLFPNADNSAPIYPHSPSKALDRARPAIGLENFRISRSAADGSHADGRVGGLATHDLPRAQSRQRNQGDDHWQSLREVLV